MRILLSVIVLLTSISAFPQASADSVGLFAIKDGQTVRIDRITHQSIKGSGGLASAFTLGMAKIKSKLEYKGATSPHHFKGTARFLMYFGTPSSTDMVKLYQFTSAYSPKDFEVAKFEVKKKVRRLTGVTASLLGSSMGVSAADGLDVVVRELRQNVYEVDVAGAPGEYCFIFMANGTNGFGGAYDFTLE